MARKNAVPTVSLPKPQVQTNGVTTRPACPKDRAWLVPLSARLFEFGPPPWRSRDSMYRALGLSLERVVCEPSSDAEILVAQDARREPLVLSVSRRPPISLAKSTRTSPIWSCVQQRKVAALQHFTPTG